ncbi:glycosyltransferase family 4 protein [Nitrolancea hollandica]|uniref:Glycosyl transferase group 1 n=1 Tax=Nitrolancea hollandica Lb TaxID=1129897 RepID=I4EHY1_9BACT|nr:glycosyltransferase family 4 protein [Nitrolancea hollandica]CCF84293.1 Glycosyl transferase group 1 [Nitrolancea hollandica Lb]
MSLRILFVTPYLPAPPDFGGASRMYHLIRETGRLHAVTTLSLIAPGDDPRVAEAALGRVVAVTVPLTARMAAAPAKRLVQLRSLASPQSFQRRFYWYAAMQQVLDRLIASESFDVVQFEFSQMGAYRVPPGVPSILDIHNIEHDVLRRIAASGSPARRLFNQIEYRKYRREEIDAWRRMRGCVATSSGDAGIVSRATKRPVEVVPNGVDLDAFSRLPLDGADPGALVFVGAMRYRPNADAARYFVEEILPRLQLTIPGVELAIVGADPPPDVVALGEMPGVRVTGTVPDVRPWMRNAGVVVVPLLSGGGTRLKILEAFAMGRPVVSTSIGAAGIEARDGEHLLLADRPEAFARAVTRLATEPGLRERLVERAYALVRDRYQWSSAAERLEVAYYAACSKGAASSASSG